MATEHDDESLGTERLPQTELDFVPGVGEQTESEETQDDAESKPTQTTKSRDAD